MLIFSFIILSYLKTTTSALVPGFPKTISVPQYIEQFDGMITLTSLPQPPLVAANMSPLEALFYESILETAKKVSNKQGLAISKEDFKKIKETGMEEMARVSINRSTDLTAYQDITAESQRRALMEYENKVVELMQTALKGSSEGTMAIKKLRSALVAVQREYRADKHYIIQWMGVFGIGFSIIAFLSGVYFMRMRTEEGLERDAERAIATQ